MGPLVKYLDRQPAQIEVVLRDHPEALRILMAKFGGGQVYVPKPNQVTRAEVYECHLENLSNGYTRPESIKDLMTRFEYTYSNVAKIVLEGEQEKNNSTI